MPESRVRTTQYLREFPELTSSLDILEKKGQGTFASVFAVQSKDATKVNRQTYALKMLIPTVDVKRIENEIRILRRLSGRCNIVRMHTAWRVRDHVFILMPFINYVPFTVSPLKFDFTQLYTYEEYYLTADEKEIVRYMRTLLVALSYIHKYHIIHRDIKPTNFLLDQRTKRFYLVDFGLAHSETYGDIDDRWDLDCDVHDETVRQKQISRQQTSTEATQQPHKKMRLEQSSDRHDNSGKDVSGVPSTSAHSVRRFSPTTRTNSFGQFSATISTQNIVTGTCVCGVRLTVCRGCRQLPRMTAARRGGTLGFRPPEVMVRHVDQTTAVDVWAAGVIFLSFISGRYPFIRVEDDLDVLHSFTHLLGYERMRNAMTSLGRRLLLDPKPPAMKVVETPATWLRARCVAIRHNEKKLIGLPPLLSKSTDEQTNVANNRDDDGRQQKPIALPASHIFPSAAYDLAVRLLEPDPHKRISATDALRHCFLRKDNSRTTNVRLIANRKEKSKSKENREPTATSSTTTSQFQVRAQFC